MYFVINNEVFEIKIIINKNDNNLPLVFETSNKVDEKYHQFNNNELCLGSGLELWQEYISDNKSIIKYMDKYIFSYFFRYCCLKKYDKTPIGEYSHSDGIREAYEDVLGVKDKKTIISLIEAYIRDSNYLCPCGSLIKFKDCHHKIIAKKIDKVPKRVIRNNLRILKGLKSKKNHKNFRRS